MTLPDRTIGPRAKCKFCPKNYTTTRGGTGHLRRHMLKCMPKNVHVPTTTQTQLQRHPDELVTRGITTLRMLENVWHETYGITHRILSITLDNASANIKSIALFIERNIPQAGGYFFHQRCACHIINVVVQSSLKEVFYNATVTLSGVYYPTSSQAIHQIVEMSDLLNTYREDATLGPAVVAIETKFKKYWSEMHFLYALGVIVDPRIKLAGLEYLLEFIGNKLLVDYSHQITDIRNKLFVVFSIYEPRFGGVNTEPSPEPDTQPLPTSWSILKRRKKDKSASSSSSTTRSAASSGAELNRFLEAQFDADENTENFDLLLWWKTYSYMYPVLSHLARDILVIPVSTVSSEQTFSTSGRIIEPRRNCLTPEMVKVLICVWDWEHARKRMQNETVEEQFIQNFSNLYVDDGSGSNQVQN
ncbi:hypothetical protein Dsin_005123 [Dipteronia sinensis]|uniref:BED-type domain-containing protein n=1 Tax=Dipteronia sinensis TaxID=43782 RepID=A0AAE0EEE4_9ROSI|nr:hypothetical protein Dsin_005123 [Dipteronia sinensis]